MSPGPKFMADTMLGKLAKWLRILGFDTRYYNRPDRKEFIAGAQSEGRVILTRDSRLVLRKNLPPHLFIHDDHQREQLKEVSRRYPIFSNCKPFSLCSACNVPIRSISKEQ